MVTVGLGVGFGILRTGVRTSIYYASGGDFPKIATGPNVRYEKNLVFLCFLNICEDIRAY